MGPIRTVTRTERLLNLQYLSRACQIVRLVSRIGTPSYGRWWRLRRDIEASSGQRLTEADLLARGCLSYPMEHVLYSFVNLEEVYSRRQRA